MDEPTLIERREKLFRFIIANLNCGVLIADREKIYFLNRAAATIFDLEGIAIEHLTLAKVFDSDFLENERPFDRLQEEGQQAVHLPYSRDMVELLVGFRKFPDSREKVLITADMLGYYSLDQTPRRVHDAEEIDLLEFLSRILGNLRDLSWAKNVPIRLQTGAGSLAIYGNKGQLEEIFTNLIGKLVTFSHRGTVTVAVLERESGASLEVAIENPLCIIKPDDYRQLVARFERDSDKAKALVELHGGRLWVDLSQGTRIHFTIPKNLT